VITVETDPKAEVRFRITFPNGDIRKIAMRADTVGMARYTFVQRSSTVTHSRSTATVSVTASNGLQTTARTATYRIGWSRIDLSVEPRAQVAGRTVLIWVHTRAHTWVTVSLTPPGKSKTLQIKLQTGSTGWGHVRYRVVHVTPTQPISVRATTRIGGSSYQVTGRIVVR
jgi:hypothetical protein